MTTITPMKKFLVKRNIPGAGSMTPAQLNEAGCGSRKLNDELGYKCLWINSFVVQNGTHCIYAAYRKEDVECHAKCLTPNKYYEVAEIFGTLDVTGSYLRNDECAGEKQAAKEVSVDSGYAPVQEKLSTGQ